MEDLLDVLTLILWPCQLLLFFCSKMLPPTSCVGRNVSWTVIMGTIRFGRFFAMVTSKNVSLTGEADGYPLSGNNNRSFLTRHVEQKRQRWKKSQSCGRSRLVICSTRSVKELVQVSSSRSMRWIQFANETLSGQSLQTRSTSTWHCSLTCSYS